MPDQRPAVQARPRPPPCGGWMRQYWEHHQNPVNPVARAPSRPPFRRPMVGDTHRSRGAAHHGRQRRRQVPPSRHGVAHPGPEAPPDSGRVHGGGTGEGDLAGALAGVRADPARRGATGLRCETGEPPFPAVLPDLLATVEARAEEGRWAHEGAVHGCGPEARLLGMARFPLLRWPYLTWHKEDGALYQRGSSAPGTRQAERADARRRQRPNRSPIPEQALHGSPRAGGHGRRHAVPVGGEAAQNPQQVIIALPRRRGAGPRLPRRAQAATHANALRQDRAPAGGAHPVIGWWTCPARRSATIVIGNFPAEALLGGWSAQRVAHAVGLAVVMVGLSHLAWRRGLRRYSSAGS
ncbi:MAG: ABC-2 family transporter protein [Candidatus Latescibacterota bacterium]